MTPEVAQKGLHSLNDAAAKLPKKWTYKDYPNLTKFKVFQNG